MYIVRHLFVFTADATPLLAPLDVAVAAGAGLFLWMTAGIINSRSWVRWPVYYVVAYGILFAGKFENQQFIYFQF